MTNDETSSEAADVGRWDPELTRRVMSVLRPMVKLYYRSEVRGLDNIPAGGCLLVSNHSGGMLTQDLAVLAVDFYAKFGYDRPLYSLGHDILFHGPAAELLRNFGLVHANRENAAAALAAGAVLLDFPGGDHDAYRPTLQANVIDFAGRTGYVTAAVRARAPIVPMVSVGGQENQLYLTRGTWLARALGLTKLAQKLGRTDMLPISIGFPFGLSMLVPVNMPLPTKVVAEVLEPVDVIAEFGESPDVHEVDAHVRRLMNKKIRELGAKRRFPVFG